MKKKIIVNNIKSPKEYYNKYNYFFNFNRKKILSENDVNLAKSGKFYKFCDNCYVKLPFFTKKVFCILSSILVAVIVAGIATPVTIFYMPHNVTLNSEYLEIVGSKNARLASDYKCTFKIKDDKLADNYMKHIRISSVKCNGNEIPVDAYSFIYQTNAKNELTINKEYLNGKIEINADLVKRESKHNSFFFEFNIEDYANFKDIEVTYPIKEKHINMFPGDEATFEKFTKGFDWQDPYFNIVDNIILNDGIDLITVCKGTYVIGTFTYTVAYNMLYIREDNAFKINIKAKEDKTLPKNLWLRSNARYTKKDEDFFVQFSSDYKSATLEVPYFFIRDNGSIAINGDAIGE